MEKTEYLIIALLMIMSFICGLLLESKAIWNEYHRNMCDYDHSTFQCGLVNQTTVKQTVCKAEILNLVKFE